MGCTAESSRDSDCGDAGPHNYYICTVVSPPSDCRILAVGNVVTTACCP
jgi:hypothetical protein